MELAKYANETLSALLPDTAAYQLFQEQTTIAEGVCQVMKKDPTRNTPAYLLCYRTFLAANNLAYGQLFAADPEYISTKTENLQGDGGSNPGAQGFIRAGNLLYLTMGPGLHNLAGDNICNNGAQAFTVAASGTQEFATNPLVSEDAWFIHFCPPFFQLPRMESQRYELSNGNVPKETMYNLNMLNSTAQALLHKVTHLPWVLNTNFFSDQNPEKYGFYVASTLSAAFGLVNQAPATKSQSSRNADNYAWMAVSP
ncbi:uncharacterized protein LY89DRAFT_758163 [Mollisia scopiformis]|uniref:Uncharacterized protein n=1 Tax=Mollisia scopiformis TaxID=149040 RepID=A0A194WU49_MOLSC|nr:uncharacterized protein LY89DRAFT_758163 [Mollisia scopiformis]KUJ11486.1 hypothetical protein LY89DRAFT_758163 [Mollisia scopiformis]